MFEILAIRILIIFFAAFFIALIFTPLSIKIASKVNAIDLPKERGMHSRPMPRLGGLAVFIGSMAAMLIFLPIFGDIDIMGITVYSDDRMPGVLLGGAFVFLVGLVDDLRGISAKVKLAGQIVGALILFQFSIRFDGIGNPFVEDALQIVHFPWPVSLLLTVLWVVGLTNAINLIDGLDGLAGGIAFIASMCIAYTAYIHGWYLICMALLALAGSTAGFLPFNFHPAKTFMGDCGALYLGFMLSAVSIMNPMKATTLLTTAIPLLVLALPIFDTVFAVFRRLLKRRPIMEADKEHLHHRIMGVGMGQRRTVLILYCISGVMGSAGILISRTLLIDALLPIVIAAMLVYVFLVGNNGAGKKKPVNVEAAAEEVGLKVLVVFGTRPEAIKMAPLVQALQKADGIKPVLCVTAQHREMLDQVLDLFELTPDYDLNIMKQNQTISQISSNVIMGIEEVLVKEQPDIVLVHGDTTTTFAAALAAFYQKIRIGHVEAGLRTYNKYSPYPEEVNRVLTGHLADLHFAPTERNRQNLLREAVDDSRIFVTGNTVIDALLTVAGKPYEFEDELLRKIDFQSRRVITVTCHRRENLGENMENIFSAIRDIALEFDDVEIVYPVHMNPKVMDIAGRILAGIDRVHLIPPLQYQPFVNLMAKSYLIVTDSGGMQEEAPSLGKPVLVVRRETERPEAIEAGTVKLAGVEKETIYGMIKKLLTDETEYNAMAHAVNPYGDGAACAKIVEILKK